jgi:acetyl esterase
VRISIDTTALEIATQRRLAGVLDALPSSVASRLGGHDLDVDGQVLDPHLALILALERRLHGAHKEAGIEERRAGMRKASAIAAGTPIPVGSTRDLVVDGADGPLDARHYAPDEPDGKPLLVFFHGGGWVVGDVDTHDQPCRLLTRYADVHVLSVAYRLAPEHPYPAPVDDAVAAWEWAVKHADELGADPHRIAVGGDSAGGNLAAVVAQQTRDAGTTAPVAQLLLYPGTDASRDRPSKNLFAEGYFLTRVQMDWYWDTYSEGRDRTDPRLSPLCADTLAGLAPALITTAAFDPLRDEGEAYAAALREAGVPTVLRRAPGLVHGYFSMTGVHRASLDESLAVAGAFGALVRSS